MTLGEGVGFLMIAIAVCIVAALLVREYAIEHRWH